MTTNLNNLRISILIYILYQKKYIHKCCINFPIGSFGSAIYFWPMHGYIMSRLFPIRLTHAMEHTLSPTIFTELSPYPWCGLYSILKVSQATIPTDKMQYFALLDRIRGVIGKNRAWRGRLVHREMMRCLLFFQCEVEYTEVARMSLTKWIKRCGALNTRYIMFITGHFVYLTIGETLSDLKMYDQHAVSHFFERL